MTTINEPKFRKIDLPELLPNVEELIVGNPAVLDEVLPQIEAQQQTKNNAPITISSKWDSVKVPIASRLFGGFDFDHDTHEDFVLIRSFTIYVAEGEAPQTISFISKIMGTETSDASGKPDAQMIASAQFMWSERHQIGERMDTFWKVSEEGNESLRISFYSSLTEERREVTIPSTISRDSLEEAYKADFRLYGHVSEVQAYLGNSSGYFSTLRGVALSTDAIKSAEEKKRRKKLAT